MTSAAVPGDRLHHVVQGSFRVGTAPDEVLTTVLGSCVATCLTDPIAGVGGLNHFLLPGDGGARGGQATRYGLHAMELLINALLKRGAKLNRLEAKVFGGANTTRSRFEIGSHNAEFALWFLENEGIALRSRDVGGVRARKLRYWPVSGRAQQMFLPAAATRTERRGKPQSAPEAGEPDLW